jgi:hypothetical protein
MYIADFLLVESIFKANTSMSIGQTVVEMKHE